MISALLATLLTVKPSVTVKLPPLPKTALGRALDGRGRTWADRIKKDFLSDAARTQGDGPRYELSISGRARRVDTTRASTVLTLYTYTGGAHGMTSYKTFNVGLGAGGPRGLKLADLFSADPHARVEAALIAKLRKNAAATWIRSGEVSGLTRDQLENFTLERDGSLRFYFEPYALGPYSAGSFIVDVNRADLGATYKG